MKLIFKTLVAGWFDGGVDSVGVASWPGQRLRANLSLS